MRNDRPVETWGTLLTAMISPFKKDGELDLAEAKRVARFLVSQQQNDGLIINGTTGESPTTTIEEKFELLKAVLQEVGDEATIIFGAGTYNTMESIQLTQEAERLGAHGIMLVNPYYNKPNQSGLYAHFSMVASKTRLPVMLYNIQGRSAINLETDTLLRLSEIENIVAVKEASGNIGQISEVCAKVPEGFVVYSGDDAFTLPILSLGGKGVVSVAGHVVGKEIKAMVRAFATDPAKARQIHHSLSPMFKQLFLAPNPVPVKFLLSLNGFECETVRLPLVPLTDSEKALLRDVMDNAFTINV